MFLLEDLRPEGNQGILNLVVDCVHECPTAYLRVEEFSLDEGLPDAVDVIDANHTSLTHEEQSF